HRPPSRHHRARGPRGPARRGPRRGRGQPRRAVAHQRALPRGAGPRVGRRRPRPDRPRRGGRPVRVQQVTDLRLSAAERRHVVRLSLEFYDRTRTGALVARMTADVEALQELVTQGLSMFLVNILVFAGAVVVMVGMSWELALGVLFVVPVLVMATRWFRRESNAAYLTLRDRVGGTLTSFQEGLAGVRVVQAFNQADAFRRRFRETNEQQFRTHLRAETITARYTTVIELTQGTAIAVTLFYGGWLTGRGVVT